MPVLNKHLQQELADFCRQRAEITAVYLFGSQAKNKAGRLSDIDLAFLLEPELISEKEYPYGYQAFLLTELIKILETNGIDAIILNAAPPLLKFQVIHYGEVIFSRSEKKRLAFHVRAFNEYQDFRPLLAVQHRYLTRRLDKHLSAEAE